MIFRHLSKISNLHNYCRPPPTILLLRKLG